MPIYRDDETRARVMPFADELEDVPLAWYIPNRGGLLASDWPPSRFYEYILQIDDIPDGDAAAALAQTQRTMMAAGGADWARYRLYLR